MASELEDVNTKSNSQQQREEDEDDSTKENRPLPKPDESSPAAKQQSIPAVNFDELEKKFAAFVRTDIYGGMLGIACLSLLPIRVAVALAVLAFCYLICRCNTMFLAPNREDELEDYAHMGGWRRAVIVHSGRFFFFLVIIHSGWFLSRFLLFVLGFYWIKETHCNPDIDGKLNPEIEGKNLSEEPGRLGVIISNHVSYMDILYYTSSSFTSFVVKVLRSVVKLPLVGLIIKCLGCVYVRREMKSSDFKGVSGVVSVRIQDAHQNKLSPMMMLFPGVLSPSFASVVVYRAQLQMVTTSFCLRAAHLFQKLQCTTTNGDYLLPFKSGAFLSKAPVLPVILRYPYQRFSLAWDSISGVRHVIFLLCQFINYLEVKRLPIYNPSQQERDYPKLYADNV